jgi:multidrug transporter EmrE-like cation transporter
MRAGMTRFYVLLGCAVFFEVLWAVMLKLSNGFSVRSASAAMVVAYVGSLVCLNGACKGLAVSLAYPIWTGLGGTLVALIGVLCFKEPLGVGKALGVALVLSGVALLLGMDPQAAEARQ